MDPVSKVSIVPRGRALGVTVSEPNEERYNFTRERLENTICMSLGGRAAEMIVFGTMTNGAADDLKRSTQLARQMVAMWGMGDKMAHIALGEGDRDVFLGEQISRQRSYSETTAREIDEEVITILRDGYDNAVRILTEHRAQLDKLAGILLEEEQVDGERVKALVNGAKGSAADNGEEGSQDGRDS